MEHVSQHDDRNSFEFVSYELSPIVKHIMIISEPLTS